MYPYKRCASPVGKTSPALLQDSNTPKRLKTINQMKKLAAVASDVPKQPKRMPWKSPAAAT